MNENNYKIISEIIKNRRSVRIFNAKKISNEIIENLIDLARFAPSNCNTQNWRFIIVNDDTLKSKIVNHGGNKIIQRANAGILICYNHQSDNYEYQDWLQSAAAAAQNILLAAHTLGCAACWICHLPRKKVLRKIFNIPKHYEPVCYIALGFTDESPKVVFRRNKLNDIFSYNKFPVVYENANKKIYIKSFLRRIYYFLPKILKMKINNFVDKYFVKKFDN